MYTIVSFNSMVCSYRGLSYCYMYVLVETKPNTAQITKNCIVAEKLFEQSWCQMTIESSRACMLLHKAHNRLFHFDMCHVTASLRRGLRYKRDARGRPHTDLERKFFVRFCLDRREQAQSTCTSKYS